MAASENVRGREGAAAGVNIGWLVDQPAGAAAAAVLVIVVEEGGVCDHHD
jgi:hypothetical protein